MANFFKIPLLLQTSLLVVFPAAAQTLPAPPRVPVPLGLLRLQQTAKSGDAPRLALTKFSIDPLPPAGGGTIKPQSNGVDALALDSDKEYGRPLRGFGRETTFASFKVYGSQTTIIEIGGARLGLTAGPVEGSLQLMYDVSTSDTLKWMPLDAHFSAGRYGGKAFAALPTITIRLDPTAGVWDLFSGSRLLADSLPLIASRRDNRQFTLKAGTEGAWLIGLVLADENPLYEDANANGIDDVFERQKRAGYLLPATSTPTERHQLASDWKAAQRAKAPPALAVQRPLPDRPAAGK